MTQPQPGPAAERPAPRRTALLVDVPDAERLVGAFRARFHADSVARRIPPHVTVLFPFVPAETLREELLQEVAAHFEAQRAFAASLVAVRRFEDHVWLAPAPRELFVDMIRATYRRFPEIKPYDGAFAEPEPHLTVGSTTEQISTAEIFEAAERELAPGLPLAFRVDAVSLYVEQPDAIWVGAARFPLR